MKKRTLKKSPIRILCLIIILTGFLGEMLLQTQITDENKFISRLQPSFKLVRDSHEDSTTKTFYVNHDPIHIEQDNFEIYDFPGSGTREDPYLIEGLKISSILSENCLEIYETTKYFYVKNCYFEGSSQNSNGIELSNVQHGTFENNIIINNNFGVLLTYSSYMNFYNNSIYNNIIGMQFDGRCQRNQVKGNKISDNQRQAIILNHPSSRNVFTWNEIISNNKDNTSLLSQAVDNRDFNIHMPEENNSFSYNYWNDWTSPDNNSDGIVDSPYLIQGSQEGNKDRFPLALIHILIKPTIIYPNGGEILNGTVEIKWIPLDDSFNHSIIYSVYYSSNNGIDWDLFTSNLISTNYSWDTTSFADKTGYLIKVVGSCPISGYSLDDISDQAFSIDNFYLIYDSEVQNSFILLSTIILPIFVLLSTFGVLILLSKQISSIITQIEDGC